MSEESIPPARPAHALRESADEGPPPVPPAISPENVLGAGQWGMLAFLLSEVAFFGTLIVAYLSFLGQDKIGPTPREALSLSLVLVTTACLLASSATVHLATHALSNDRQRQFCLWWLATIVLGVVFLAGTGYEWRELIERHHLTISRNLFGTTYYTLVGFHGLHVSLGVIAMLVVLALAARRAVNGQNKLAAELIGWYWHFVDGVWIVVFTVVYVAGR
ncbi:MAG TPA: heme-copper oxidase subunit III [Pirellulales bacterium]|jgi:cytochrome c oxidase subunit 3/cytochrome o ubiquinol oxidase subunit 3|nr:heme-copper oxidase subunit III [Pirellulales bacterium]